MRQAAANFAVQYARNVEVENLPRGSNQESGILAGHNIASHHTSHHVVAS